jgi:hypothetical protein
MKLVPLRLEMPNTRMVLTPGDGARISTPGPGLLADKGVKLAKMGVRPACRRSAAHQRRR